MALTPAQLEEHRRCLSSSKAPVIWLGECYRTTRVDLWERMTGRAEWPDLDDELWIQMGNAAEGVCAMRFAKRTGLDVRIPTGTWRHPGEPDVIAHIDREVVLPDGTIAPLECKWTDSMEASEWGPDETDLMPSKHLVQLQHQLACEPQEGRRADFGFGAVIIGRAEFRIYKVPRSPRFIAALLAAEHEFMACVREDVPPEPRLPEEWRSVYRDSAHGKVIEADADIIRVIARREALISRSTAFEDAVAALDIELLRYARDAEAITVGGEPVFSLKTTKSGARPLRIVSSNWHRARRLFRSPA